nr:MAG TPA: SAP domain [Caudoviricetes sp.]
MKGHLDKKQLEEEYKVDELRELAKSLGLSPDGKKAELVERIAAVEVDVPDEDDEQQAAANTPTANEQQAAGANVSVSDTTVKVIVTETYKDLQRDITQHAGDTFEVTKERAAQLIEAGVAKAAE